MSKRILITAHAGCLDKKLDSLEYIKEALKYNIDIVEVDVRFNKLGIAVLSHDEIKEQEELVTLKEALLIIEKNKNVMVNLDMKETTYISSVIKDIKDTNMVGRALITGAEPNGRDVELLSTVEVYCCTNGNVDVTRLNDIEYCKEIVDDVIKRRSIGLNLNYIDVTETIVKELHKKNKKMYVWTVDDLINIEKMKALNVDSITTNNINLVCKKVI